MSNLIFNNWVYLTLEHELNLFGQLILHCNFKFVWLCQQPNFHPPNLRNITRQTSRNPESERGWAKYAQQRKSAISAILLHSKTHQATLYDLWPAFVLQCSLQGPLKESVFTFSTKYIFWKSTKYHWRGLSIF